MGVADGATHGKEKKRSSRGSTNNKRRLDAFGARGPADGADWGGCDPDKIQGVVTGITELGGAVTFGTSRDGGAHSLTLLLDDSRETLWFNGNADLSEELLTVIQKLAALA